MKSCSTIFSLSIYFPPFKSITCPPLYFIRHILYTLYFSTSPHLLSIYAHTRHTMIILSFVFLVMRSSSWRRPPGQNVPLLRSVSLCYGKLRKTYIPFHFISSSHICNFGRHKWLGLWRVYVFKLYLDKIQWLFTQYVYYNNTVPISTCTRQLFEHLFVMGSKYSNRFFFYLFQP